jgi:hypothetical protein
VGRAAPIYAPANDKPEEMHKRMILLSALFALGAGLAGPATSRAGFFMCLAFTPRFLFCA